MKNILLFTASLLSFYSSAYSQVPNASYTDCNGNTESIYSIIGQGLPLLIVSNGFDCSICMSHAPGIKTFSEQHPDIRIWGAMGYRYSSATPTCINVNDWKNNYTWNNIFMFSDVNEDWEGSGYPTYYVISPLDSSVQYEGASFTQASAKALELVPTGIRNNTAESAKVFYEAATHTLQLNLSGTGKISTIFLASLTGQIIFEAPVSPYEKSLRLPLSGNITTGMYLVFLREESGKMFSSKIMVR